MKTIVVCNPAAKSGGALIILEQFLSSIAQYDKENFYYVIASQNELKKYEKENIEIIIIEEQNYFERIIWDNFKLKNYLKRKKITPDLFVSFQNTGVNLSKEIPQIVYFHQSIPLSSEKWNLFKKDERLFWKYKNIFPFFIKQHLNKVKKIIVQTNWTRESFSKKFNYNIDNILIIKPNVKIPSIEKVKNIAKPKFRIFYPATPFKFKNHQLILDALENIDNDFECIFTFSRGDNLVIDKKIINKGLEDKVKLIGEKNYQKILEFYKSADLVVFPSTIETFGLPLIEAANFGLPILAADKSYSREVLKGYSGVKFLDPCNSNDWKIEIEKQINSKSKFKCFNKKYSSSWEDFFKLIKGE